MPFVGARLPFSRFSGFEGGRAAHHILNRSKSVIYKHIARDLKTLVIASETVDFWSVPKAAEGKVGSKKPISIPRVF